ncbi:MAG: metalloregulator ArsR/SmtB family transcription factor [Parvularculaceae bacterium]
MAVVFAALGDDTRLVIISKLQDGSEHSISNLTRGLSLTRQGVSRHLAVLEEAKLVRRHRVGRETRYHFEVEVLNQARDYLAHASAQWDDAIKRLTKHLKG